MEEISFVERTRKAQVGEKTALRRHGIKGQTAALQVNARNRDRAAHPGMPVNHARLQHSQIFGSTFTINSNFQRFQAAQGQQRRRKIPEWAEHFFEFRFQQSAGCRRKILRLP